MPRPAGAPPPTQGPGWLSRREARTRLGGAAGAADMPPPAGVRSVLRDPKVADRIELTAGVGLRAGFERRLDRGSLRWRGRELRRLKKVALRPCHRRRVTGGQAIARQFLALSAVTAAPAASR